MTAFADACGMGLCLFFTLSAYLIATLLLDERRTTGTVSIPKFYIRRTLRIWPLYLFGLLIGAAFALFDHDRQQLTALTWYLFFVGNFYCALFGWHPGVMSSLWSISVEEQFYLVWPWAMRRFTRKGLLVCACVFLLASDAMLMILGWRHADADSAVWANTLVQFQMFGVGILLALFPKIRLSPGLGRGLALALAGPVLWFAACFAFHPNSPGPALGGPSLIAGYALTAIGCAAVLVGFSAIPPVYMPAWAVGLGKISYGLYVYHMLSIRIVAETMNRFGVGHFPGDRTAIAFFLNIVLAKLSYAWLEKPFLQLKRRFELVHSRPV